MWRHSSLDLNRVVASAEHWSGVRVGTLSHGVQRGSIIVQVRDGGGLDAGAGSVDGETCVGRRTDKIQLLTRFSSWQGSITDKIPCLTTCGWWKGNKVSSWFLAVVTMWMVELFSEIEEQSWFCVGWACHSCNIWWRPLSHLVCIS